MISPYRRKREAPPDDAAARLRKWLASVGEATCAGCRAKLPASAVDVDHKLPLYQGGDDVPSNVQVLCRPCHKRKTRRDAAH